ncbi:IS3 family transposase [Salmonirosea aquatica]|uniref:IS3 family transposase n=1 Tax=Salmonirosea aquatica TaxID=2654236 RepID=A0A7C9BJR5_9BACT|nr:IS3 family transposase [Cytophagaceae bacterium SJW1-29]
MDRTTEAARDFKKSCRHFQPTDLRLIYRFIEQEEGNFPVRLLCNTLEVSRSSYYAYRADKTYQPSEADRQMTAHIQEIFWENRRRYGSRRVQKALLEEGVEAGRHRVRRLMEEQNWRAIQPRSFVPRTTDSSHGLRACPNLLVALGLPDRPNQAWVGEITYLPLASGDWAYLANWLEWSATAAVLPSDCRLVCGRNNAGKPYYQSFRSGNGLAET